MQVSVQPLDPHEVNVQVCVLECGWGYQRGLCCCWSVAPLPYPGGQCVESGRRSCAPPPHSSAAGTAPAPSPCVSRDAAPPACSPGSEGHKKHTPSTASFIPSPTLTSPHLPSPTLTYPHLPSPTLSSPLLPSPTLTSPLLPSPTLSHPLLPSPTLTSPLLPSPCIMHKSGNKATVRTFFAQLPATGLGSPYLCFGLGSIWSRQVFQFELGHFGFVEVVSQLQPVLGQTDASRPGECGSLFLTAEHLNVLLVWDKLTRNGLGGEKQAS